jgi:hypothetical protein
LTSLKNVDGRESSDQPNLPLGQASGDPHGLSMHPSSIEVNSGRDFQETMAKIKSMGGRVPVIHWDKKRGNGAWRFDVEWKR